MRDVVISLTVLETTGKDLLLHRWTSYFGLDLFYSSTPGVFTDYSKSTPLRQYRRDH